MVMIDTRKPSSENVAPCSRGFGSDRAQEFTYPSGDSLKGLRYGSNGTLIRMCLIFRGSQRLRKERKVPAGCV
jgi:hypothetical protein